MLEAFRRRLDEHPAVRDVRGRGLMIGIELDRDVNQFKQAALERGLLLNVTQNKVIRLLPPLIIDADQAQQIVDGVCTLIEELEA
jgi:acetylornithine aminotransferase